MELDKQLFSVFDSETGDVSVEKLYTFLFDELPSVYAINFAIDLQTVLKKLEKKYQLSQSNYLLKLEESCKDDWLKVDYNRSAYLIKLAEKLLLFISSAKAEIYYSQSIDFDQIRDLIKAFKIKSSNKQGKRKFYLLRTEEGDYGLKPFDVKDYDLDLELYYNDDFIQFHQSVEKFLNDSQQAGIVLIYGKPGTGKTSYLKYLFSKFNKKFIVIPKRMFNVLENPNFYFYISELHDSVIVLEDCDNLLTGVAKTNPIAEFLKNADGLFSNNFQYKIICTLSALEHQLNLTYIQKADQILKYEMRELDVQKANKLREKLQLKGKLTKPTVLSEVLKPNLEPLKTRRLGFK